ncbi:MAG: response regulator [Dehalococcoidia bacterium]
MDFAHQRVANEIRIKVLNGDYKTGERLPRQHDLAKDHNVAYNTLKKALDILEAEGYLVRRNGQGTYAILPEDLMPFALVVDDDESVRRLFVRSLEDNLWRSVVVASGQEALECLNRHRFDLIFLDLAMPAMTGPQVFREIRDLDNSTNVVIITAYPESNLMSEALDVGPFALMKKPFSQDEIRSLLQTYNPRLNEVATSSASGDRAQ